MHNSTDQRVHDIWQCLETIEDPELPTLNIVELGIVRDVAFAGERLQVTLTPTYSGCPAKQVIEEEVAATLRNQGFDGVEVLTVFAPPWTTDWLTDAAKAKLKAMGIAPPCKACAQSVTPFAESPDTIHCPYCDSDKTIRQSEFGSTPCKALYFCDGCHQPFDYFKSI
jgi:ring-1,2-phenylacetyl-CoA epoxidase subunit PaaD